LRDKSRLLAAAVLVTSMISMAIIAGCGNETEETGSESGAVPLPSALTLGEQVVLTAEEYLGAEPFAGANRGRGEQQAQICKACHSLNNGGPNMIGPALYGFLEGKLGRVADSGIQP
jgi:cytochrome c